MDGLFVVVKSLWKPFETDATEYEIGLVDNVRVVGGDINPAKEENIADLKIVSSGMFVDFLVLYK